MAVNQASFVAADAGASPLKMERLRKRGGGGDIVKTRGRSFADLLLNRTAVYKRTSRSDLSTNVTNTHVNSTQARAIDLSSYPSVLLIRKSLKVLFSKASILQHDGLRLG